MLKPKNKKTARLEKLNFFRWQFSVSLGKCPGFMDDMVLPNLILIG